MPLHPTAEPLAPVEASITARMALAYAAAIADPFDYEAQDIFVAPPYQATGP